MIKKTIRCHNLNNTCSADEGKYCQMTKAKCVFQAEIKKKKTYPIKRIEG
jgi:hypothetical protein